MALPEPKPGLVIPYWYLWAREAKTGATEGKKPRPCAIVVTTLNTNNSKTVVVVPITHSQPDELTYAIELPPLVKQYLKLDTARSWVIVSEMNEFTWSGFDITHVPGDSTKFEYGMIPPNLFAQIKSKLLAFRAANITAKPVSRD